MAEASGAVTSAELAARLATDGAVVRRTMAGLKAGGIVRSAKGHRGGWQVARPLGEITLGDVYGALGQPRLLAMGLHLGEPGCLIEGAVNGKLAAVFAEAEALVAARLSEVTLEAVLTVAVARKEDQDA